MMLPTRSPAEFKSWLAATRGRPLGRLLRFTLFALVFLLSPARAPAELYQTIRVNVMSPEKFRIGRVVYPLAEMTQVVAGEVRGPNRVYVKLYIPLGLNKSLVEEIKAHCRQAGATSFFIQYKS
ncbi:hypothetical protein Verru16b_00211 [Lacunisphaera limnophila]|uniref:Uncharacterized protein n=1 Tax=Lacunisphaera limnophila TaxID=1838286 RepID=A0A1I7PHS7_9BACT|nr:hypothetical protein [Lacunisphaera limnophila]AOS43170.1 hypothetical protein Verru16b_00211 [Lacunisphaera limnophila]